MFLFWVVLFVSFGLTFRIFVFGALCSRDLDHSISIFYPFGPLQKDSKFERSWSLFLSSMLGVSWYAGSGNRNPKWNSFRFNPGGSRQILAFFSHLASLDTFILPGKNLLWWQSIFNQLFVRISLNGSICVYFLKGRKKLSKESPPPMPEKCWRERHKRYCDLTCYWGHICLGFVAKNFVAKNQLLWTWCSWMRNVDSVDLLCFGLVCN